MDYLALTGSELNGLSTNVGLNTTLANGGIGTIVSAVIPYFFAIAGFALTFYVVAAGYSMMMSKGDERAVAAAKAKLTYGVTGFFIIFAAYWVVKLVGAVLQIDAVNTIFK